MPIERKRVARHILVPDTNILWHGDKSECVSPKFQEFWDRNANNYEIDLVLPEVVFAELRFQQTTSALKSLQKVNAEFKKLSSVAASNYSHRVTEKKIRSDVEKKLNSWVQLASCKIFEVPVDTIDWKRLINDAIWRVSPFVEEKNTEKGFRDAIIIETAVAIANANLAVDLAFISSDKLVLKAAQNRLDPRCNCYETIEEFETFLKLTDEKLTNEFVKAIQTRARIKFHDDNDKTCLLYREKLISMIRDRFTYSLLPPDGDISLGLRRGLLIPTNKWTPTSSESVWIRAPEFINLEGENEFFWRSKIIFVQLFKYEGSQTGGLLTGLTKSGDEKLRQVEFPVKWKSKVAKNGRFLSMEYQEVEEPKTTFEPITDAQREDYKIGIDAGEKSS